VKDGVFAHWPNRITAVRFVGALVLFVVFALMGERPADGTFDVLGAAWPMRHLIHGCFWLFVVIAATDFLDGYLARKDGHVSAFGRIADPFTDKVLIVGTMTFFCVMPWSRDFVPAWLVVIVLAREFLVTGIRGFVESQGKEFGADGFGKIKMIAQCCAVGGVMWIHAFPWPDAWRTGWEWLTLFLVGATLLTTVGSGLSYVLRAPRVLAGD
jgi:CDP-diacylglycerol--glycerol-3-phosphate 3-phosphatidyltransferase